jgi:hypothetical protein
MAGAPYVPFLAHDKHTLMNFLQRGLSPLYVFSLLCVKPQRMPYLHCSEQRDARALDDRSEQQQNNQMMDQVIDQHDVTKESTKNKLMNHKFEECSDLPRLCCIGILSCSACDN